MREGGEGIGIGGGGEYEDDSVVSRVWLGKWLGEEGGRR